MRIHLASKPPARRGVVLLVVLALLTLFAVVAITFVFFAEQEALTASLYKDAENRGNNGLPEGDMLFDWFLRRLVYDDTDTGSSLRTHSLVRNVYGSAGCDVFNGTGRLHLQDGLSSGVAVLDSYYLPNFGNRGGGVTYTENGFGSLNPPYTYPDMNNLLVGAMNADGEVLARSFVRGPIPIRRDDGSIFWFDPYHPNNAYFWISDDPSTRPGGATAPFRKYGWLNGEYQPDWNPPPGANPVVLTPLMARAMVFRPGPWDHPNDPTNNRNGFPSPADFGGDVRNLPPDVQVRLPNGQKISGNDSYWFDANYPARLGPNGRYYKPLFAIFAMPIDGRLNVNYHGNTRAINQANPQQILHTSNHGVGPWEINPGHVLTANTNPPAFPGEMEWPKLFQNNPLSPGAAPFYGRYGANNVPRNPGALATPWNGTFHAYGQMDFDGARYLPGPNVLVPTPNRLGTPVGRVSFPVYSAGYDNASAATELPVHPSLYPGFGIVGDDRLFLPWNMEALLRYGDTGADGLESELRQLLPQNFGNKRIRNMVTTNSADSRRIGIIPWYHNWNNANRFPDPPPGPGVNPNDPLYGTKIPFPDLAVLPPPLPGSDLEGEFSWNPVTNTSNYRANPSGNFGGSSGKLLGQQVFQPPGYPQPIFFNGKLNLNVPLPQYPPQARYDDGGAAQAAFQMATTARQYLADSIYRRLLAAVGVPPISPGPNPGQRANPNWDQLIPRRYLAQLAANIVDYIDEDDFSTPFNFYTAQADVDAGSQTSFDPTRTGGAAGQELPSYWVFGTEMPRVVLNEVIMEYKRPPQMGMMEVNGDVEFKTWLELHNLLPLNPSNNPNLATQDRQEIPLYVAPAGARPGYAPYKIVVAKTNTGDTWGSPLLTPPAGQGNSGNGNVLGTHDTMRTETTDTDFSCPPATNPLKYVDDTNVPNGPNGVPPPYLRPYDVVNTNGHGFFLVGPNENTSNSAIVADNAMPMPGPVPHETPWLRINSMKYTVQYRPNDPNGWTWQIGGQDVTNEVTTDGLTVLLRRLANPRMPYNPNFWDTTNNIPNPNYNPYITVDYVEKVRPQDMRNPAPLTRSFGKRQPLVSGEARINPANGQVVQQAAASGERHTLGRYNEPPNQKFDPAGNIVNDYDWLVHLDRQLASPLELLHVSAYKPHELTHRFMVDRDNNGILNDGALPNQKERFQHVAPWFDQLAAPGTSNRLYRFLEFVECNDRRPGLEYHHRSQGKINLNFLFDREVFRALCDAQACNNFDQNAVDAIYNSLMQPTQRLTNNGTVGPFDRPFLSLAVGPSDPDQQYPTPNGVGIDDTFLRIDPLNPNKRLFEVITDPAGQALLHPYQRYELMSKIFNNVTTRSNVFAVWMTVGFFEVDVNTNQLKQELGRAEGRHVRHRAFAVIDRSILEDWVRYVAGINDQYDVVNGRNFTVNFSAVGMLENTTLDPRAQGVWANSLDPVAGAPPLPSSRTVRLTSVTGIQQGQYLLVGAPGNEEVIQVSNVDTNNRRITAVFSRPHNVGFPVNDGRPPPCVLHWSIIE